MRMNIRAVIKRRGTFGLNDVIDKNVIYSKRL